LNAGGRRSTAIEQARAQLMPDLPKFLARLAELTQSSNESVRLAAIKECLDRLIGRSPIFVDSVTAKVDIGAMYLAALKRANGVIDGGGDNSINGVGAASDLTK
jgi:hypothetical protein